MDAQMRKWLGTMVALVATVLAVRPAGAQDGPPPLYTAVHGDTVFLYVIQPPERHSGFVVYRSTPTTAPQRLEPVVRPAQNPTVFVSRLGQDAGRVKARLGVDTDLGLFRAMQADPFTAYASGLLYPSVGRALGRVFRDTTAASGATYDYRLVYLDREGEETDETRTVRVSVEERSIPRPTNLEADPGPTRMRLTWGYPDHTGETEDAIFGFRVERAQGDGPFEAINEQPIARNDAASVLDWVDRSVQPGTSYRYRLRPVDFTGRAGPASEPVETRAVDDAPPRAPLDVVTTPGEGRVRVDWRVAPQERVVGYHVERSEGLSEPFARLTTDTLIPVDQPSWLDTTVMGGQQYFFRVVAVDTAGLESRPSNPIAAMPTDTTPPAAPGGLALATEERTLQVAWAPSSSPDVDGYHVFRGEDRDHLVRVTEAPLEDTSFVDAGVPEEGGLHPGRRYHVSVLAVDEAGNASEGVRDSITVPDDQPPEPPTALRATPHHGRWVQLRWSASPTADVASYALRRVAGADTATLGSHAADAEGAVRDTTVATGTRYVYELAAVDSAGNRSAPAVDTLLFADPTPPPAPRHVSVERADTGVEVRWERVVSRDLAGYRVYRAVIPTGVYEPVSELIPADAERVFVDTDADGRHYYRVRAVDSSGNVSRPTEPRRAPGGES
jgi:fibronectin type 3 domain-containing protein